MLKSKKMLSPYFWEGKSLDQLSSEEWEALCDHCGLCCLYKLEDEESGDIYLTNVVCRFLDRSTGSCLVYEDRRKAVPTCIQLNPQNVSELTWIPPTCAYRLLADGKPLPSWHPLITGSSIKNSDFFINNKVVSEAEVDLDDLENHILS